MNANHRTGGYATHDSAFVEALADELDLDTEVVAGAIEAASARQRTEFRAPRRSAFQDRLDSAVEAGEITDQEADAIAEGREHGVLPIVRADRHGDVRHPWAWNMAGLGHLARSPRWTTSHG